MDNWQVKMNSHAIYFTGVSSVVVFQGGLFFMLLDSVIRAREQLLMSHYVPTIARNLHNSPSTEKCGKRNNIQIKF